MTNGFIYLFILNWLSYYCTVCILVHIWQFPICRSLRVMSLDRAPTALAHQLPKAVGSASSLTAVPSTAVGQACVSPHGQHCGCLVHQLVGRSHRMSQLTRRLLLWSHTQFKSLRAVHISGKLNRAADALSRQLTFPGQWRLHPETIRLIWSRFGDSGGPVASH